MNTLKLKARLLENGFNVSFLAKRLGVSESTLYRKMSKENKGEFSIKEVKDIIKILELEQKDIQKIFFCSKVAETQ